MSYSPPNYGGYERSKRDVNYKYGDDSITNAYGRFISQQRGSRGLSDMSRGFGRAYPRQKASFAPRGLSGGGIDSGTMQQSMQEYVGDYARNYGRAQQDVNQELQQYDLNQGRLDEWRQQSLNDIEAQKANEIAGSANNILWLRQMLGGM